MNRTLAATVVTLLAIAPASALGNPERAIAPETTIVEAPGSETFERHPGFAFESDLAGADFECRIGTPRWTRCGSPLRSKSRLSLGRHDFRVRAVMDGIADRTPAVAAFTVVSHDEVIGHSIEGRAIRARRSGDPSSERKVLIVGSIHGDEPQGLRVIDQIRHRYGKRAGDIDLWTISTVNPDGSAHDTRGNAHRVDLNRNFAFDFDPQLSGGYFSGPHAFSEPESRAVRDLSRRVRPDLAIWYHQPWGETLVPCNHTGAIARRYARLSGLDEAPGGCNSYSRGSAINWQYHAFGTAAFVVELPERDLREHEVRRHARAAFTLAADPDAGEAG